MPLFLGIYFTYRFRYNIEVDEEKVATYNISVGVCLWFCRPDVGLILEAWMQMELYCCDCIRGLKVVGNEK
jgi:hypothetical protein